MMRRWSQDLTDTHHRSRRGLYGPVSWEWTLPYKLRREFSLRLHLGTRCSETPVDVHGTIGGAGIYLSLESRALGRVCGVLTRGMPKDLRLSLHDGNLWWRLWISDEHCSPDGHSHWVRGKYRPWRCRAGSIPVNPLDVLYGSPKYSYENVAESVGYVALPEGSYEVKLKLQHVTHGRKGRHQRNMGWSVDWASSEGIPWTFDKSWGWKGTRVYGSAVKIADGAEKRNWIAVAEAKIAARALEEREKTGWTIEHERQVNDR